MTYHAQEEDEMREILAQVHDSFGLAKTAVVIRTPGSEPSSSIGFGACIAAMRRVRQTGSDFQDRVQPWMMACFGPEISADKIERNHRFLEEALELVQSIGCTADKAHQLVDYVFGRPVGEPSQEVGGVMVTLAALCLANNLNMHEAGETELTRIWTKVEAIRAKQAAKPKHSPLPQVATIPVPAHEEGEKPVCKSYHSRVLNGTCQNCGRAYMEHFALKSDSLQAGLPVDAGEDPTPFPDHSISIEKFSDGRGLGCINCEARGAELAHPCKPATPPAPAVESGEMTESRGLTFENEMHRMITARVRLFGDQWVELSLEGPESTGSMMVTRAEAVNLVELSVEALRLRSTRTAVEVTEEMAKALQPFARLGGWIPRAWPDERLVEDTQGLTAKNFRDAHAALAAQDGR